MSKYLCLPPSDWPWRQITEVRLNEIRANWSVLGSVQKCISPHAVCVGSRRAYKRTLFFNTKRIHYFFELT